MERPEEPNTASLAESGLIDRLLHSIIKKEGSLSAKGRAKIVKRVWELLLDVPKGGNGELSANGREFYNWMHMTEVSMELVQNSKAEDSSMLKQTVENLIRCKSYMEDDGNSEGPVMKKLSQQQAMVSLLLALASPPADNTQAPTPPPDRPYLQIGEYKVEASDIGASMLEGGPPTPDSHAECLRRMNQPPKWVDGESTSGSDDMEVGVALTAAAMAAGVGSGSFPTLATPREGSQEGGVLNEQPQLDVGAPHAQAGGAISTAEEAILPADVEAAIGTEALLALQGLEAAKGRLQNLLARPGSLSSSMQVVRPIIHAANHRCRLDALLAVHHSTSIATAAADPACQAFAVEVGHILAGHSLALQNLHQAVRKRRQEEAPTERGESDAGSGAVRMSLLEIVAHTATIRDELECLMAVCSGSDEPSGLQGGRGLQAGGGQLLDRLYCALQHSHGGCTSLLRQLFASTFRPFAAQLKRRLFSTAATKPLDDSEWPGFLAGMRDVYEEAGQQLRMLCQLGDSRHAALVAALTCTNAASVAESDSGSPGAIPSFDLVFDHSALLQASRCSLELDARQSAAIQHALHCLEELPGRGCVREDGGGDGGQEAAVEVVVEVCLLQPMRVHHRNVSRALAELFRQAVDPEALLTHLQAAFFFSAGRFGAALVGGLSWHAEAHGSISRLDWQACIDEAATMGMVSESVQGIKLVALLQGGSHSVPLTTATLGGLSPARLSLQPAFPHSLLLDEEAVRLYGDVAAALMEVILVRQKMQQAWCNLLAKEHLRDLKGAALDGRLKWVLVVRQQADQLAAAVLSSLWQAFSSAWTVFAARLKEDWSLSQLQQEHHRYLRACHEACLLEPGAAAVKRSLSLLLLTSLDLALMVERIRSSGLGFQEGVADEGTWTRMHSLLLKFESERLALQEMLAGEAHFGLLCDVQFL